MTDIFVAFITIGFGVLTWGLLAFSDWLMGEKH